MATTQGESTPPNKQMSKVEMMNVIRPHVPNLIKKTLELVDSAPNDSVRLGAIKLLLGKVLPDLKATELTGDETKALVVRILGYGDNDNPSTEAEGSSKSS